MSSIKTSVGCWISGFFARPCSLLPLIVILLVHPVTSGAWVFAADASSDYLGQARVQDFIDEMVAQHGFEKSALNALFKEVRPQQKVLDAISRPAERVLQWHEYRKIFLTQERIERGADFWATHADTLARAEQELGVAPEYVVAIIGVETFYGRHKGKYRVIDALATLAFDYPPRAKFFRKELVEFLLLTREEKFEPLQLVGSYAGAMGYGQFISSSMRAYAIDFDGDGQRDILTNPVDAIGSVANYFRRHGWRGDEHVVVPAALGNAGAAKLVKNGLVLDHSIASLRREGVYVPSVSPSQKAALLRMETTLGPQFWVALNDFYAITRYNHSPMYALAVHQLAQAIEAAR